jgi:3-phytase
MPLSPRRSTCLLAGFALSLFVADLACSSSAAKTETASSPQPTAGRTDGDGPSGGHVATGGIAIGGSMSGAVDAGGRSQTGGAASSEGAEGGVIGTGGLTSTGGVTGGQSSTGGQLSHGGTTATGGGMSLGGVVAGGFASGTRTTSGGVNTAGTRGGSGVVSSTGGAVSSTSSGTVVTGGTSAGTVPQIPAPPLPTVESVSLPAGSVTDLADDSAIYANPTSPELSVVVADDKDDSNGGIAVFSMQGQLLQFRQDGKIGNVDLRADFPFGGKSIVLVGANNRSNDTLIFWQLDPATQRLSVPIGDGTKTVSPNYGFCLYHSTSSGKFYAFVTQETGSSTMEQYELGEKDGKLTATKVRSFEVGSITEGCVADDDLGRLYVAQEDVALWRYDAEPTGGSTRAAIATVGDGTAVADLEGVALAKGPGKSGYVVVSIQSQSRFAMYDRETNALVRSFTVGANGAIDATSETDGLDISTANLGPGFPKGALVVHDGSNTGGTTSNLKFVPLQ